MFVRDTQLRRFLKEKFSRAIMHWFTCFPYYWPHYKRRIVAISCNELQNFVLILPEAYVIYYRGLLLTTCMTTLCYPRKVKHRLCF